MQSFSPRRSQSKVYVLVFTCLCCSLGNIAKLYLLHSAILPASTALSVCLLSSCNTKNTYKERSAYRMHVDVIPFCRDPRPCSRKYVARLQGQSNWIWRATDALSIPTLAAFVMTNTQKSASLTCVSSQKRQIFQNLSILWSNLLMWITSTFNFILFNLHSKWSQKCCDCFGELQKMTALIDGFSCRRFVARVDPFKTYCPVFAKMKLRMSISC